MHIHLKMLHTSSVVVVSSVSAPSCLRIGSRARWSTDPWHAAAGTDADAVGVKRDRLDENITRPACDISTPTPDCSMLRPSLSVLAALDATLQVIPTSAASF